MPALSLAAVYRLHVSLDGVEPMVWRRVRVRSDETLAGLHEILQLAMGWSNSHIHLFETEGGEYGEAGCSRRASPCAGTSRRCSNATKSPMTTTTERSRSILWK